MKKKIFFILQRNTGNGDQSPSTLTLVTGTIHAIAAFLGFGFLQDLFFGEGTL